MKKLLISLVAIATIYLLAANFQPSQTQAQTGSTADAISLIAMPPRAGEDGNLRANPGETIQTNIRVRNATNSTLTLRSFAQDFIVKEDGITPIPVKDTVTNRWSLSSWMTVTPNQHTLSPRETAEMAVVIEIPDDAMPGGHYAMIIHEPVNPNDEPAETKGSGAGVTQRIGTLFYVTVEGPINEEAYIRDFQFKKFQKFGPVPFSFKIRNQSDIHIKPRMSIAIFNMLGQQSESLEIESANVFPLNSRDFAGKWDKIWGFGLYTAKVTASYGETGQVIVDTTSFWIIPLRIILSILFGILLIVLLILTVKKHTEKKLRLEQEKVNELQMKFRQNQKQDQDSIEE